MLLVNVGPHTINIDHVVAFIDNDDHIRVVFDAAHPSSNGRASKGTGGHYTLQLEGEEAERMRAWLKRNAEGVRGSETTGFSIS